MKMKHRVSYRKLGRDTAHRLSMLRTMVSQLIQYERIETTLPKAKELRRLADKVITLGKEGTLASRRRAAGIVRGDGVLKKLFGELSERYKDRNGGYSRVLRTRRRQNDAAQMAFIEYVDRPGELRPARQGQTLLPAAAEPLLENSKLINEKASSST